MIAHNKGLWRNRASRAALAVSNTGTILRHVHSSLLGRFIRFLPILRGFK
jgi:hypothetical protein